jgi:hypothetical protein
MSQCNQCGRPAVFRWGSHLLCVSCGTQVQQALAAQQRAQNERLAQLMAYENYLSEMMGWMMGTRASEPQIRIPQPIHANINRGPTLNNINIDRSVIGMLNAGSIQDVQRIDINVTALAHSGNDDIANALKTVTEAVASAQDLPEPQRAELLDQLSVVSEQAALTPETRKAGIFKPMLSALATGLNAVGSLAQVWTVTGDVICAYFGVPNPLR